MGLNNAPTVSALIVEGFDEGGFRAEHAQAVAMADASPMLLNGCKAEVIFLDSLPASAERNALIKQLTDAMSAAGTHASRNAF